MPITANRFLSRLPPDISSNLRSRCTPVGLPVRTVLYGAGDRPRFAYFLTSGIASVVTKMHEGRTIEVELIGPEGIVGLLPLLGRSRIQTDCFMQIEGTGLRMDFSVLQEAFQASSAMRDETLELLLMRMITISQLSGCNRLHGTEERLARWLLMVSDRIRSDDIGLTQEFLAEMLGSNRTTVTQTAAALQQQSLISYHRGQIRILDRVNLESAACSCYADLKALYDGLYSLAPQAYGLRKPSSWLGQKGLAAGNLVS